MILRFGGEGVRLNVDFLEICIMIEIKFNVYDFLWDVVSISVSTLALKAPRKNASEKLRLLKSSAANNCLTLLTNLSI